MNLILIDNVLVNPDSYVEIVNDSGFSDIENGSEVFKNIQVRDNDDEFCKALLDKFPDYSVVFNSIKKSVIKNESEFLVKIDRSSYDVVAILFLNKDDEHDSVAVFDEKKRSSVFLHSRFNRAIILDADTVVGSATQYSDHRIYQVVFLNSK